MESKQFANLFSPITIRGLTIKNRIVSTGHETAMAGEGGISEPMVAYHRARAAGGAGLIIIEGALVHESGVFVRHPIPAYSDDCIPGYRRLAEAVHAEGAAIFGQLFHPGREIIDSLDGSAPVSYAPSPVANERFHVMPAAMSRELIAEVIAGFGDGARRMQRAGLDGVEIVASHGYLPAQFLNPRVNQRDDEYGGDLPGRLRFIREAAADIRARVGDAMVLGLRISADDLSHQGLGDDEVTDALVALDGDGVIDYFSIVTGSSATIAGSLHIVPPMLYEIGYTAPYAAALKARISRPLICTGRINDPRIAEKIVAGGEADLCGMTRAMICDPEMANKAAAGRLDDIRACIGCNQACIGHFLTGYPISCIQHPETGRELTYASRKPAARRRKVLVAGGGPAGMKAAAVAAERGHDVTLFEASGRLGGQVKLAQLLPDRAEFGGLIPNLEREMELAGVTVVRNTRVDAALIASQAPEAVIVATGARPFRPPLEGAEEAHVVDAWQVLENQANVGAAVVIADWRCDWIGLGLAEKLTLEGSSVRLCANGYMPGWTIPQYVRDSWLGKLHKLGVEIIPLVRLAGADAESVYFQHTASGEAVICENADTLVLSLGHQSLRELDAALADFPGPVHHIGDCAAPRTVEEAVLEGLKAGVAV